jgi:hypothetical protein
MAYALHPVAISAFCLVSFLFPMGCRAEAGTPASGERKWGFQAQSDALRSPAEQSPGGGSILPSYALPLASFDGVILSGKIQLHPLPGQTVAGRARARSGREHGFLNRSRSQSI